MRAGLILGAGIVVLALLTFPRAAARGLVALADVAAAVRGNGVPRGTAPATPHRELQLTPPRLAKVPAPAFTPIQSDVVSAMVNLGMGREQARQRVQAAGDSPDFETLFRKVQAAA
jgi:hypothetical protein